MQFQAEEGQEHDWEQPAQVSQECVLPDQLSMQTGLALWIKGERWTSELWF